MSTSKERDKLKKLEESAKFGRLIYRGGVNLRDSDDPKDKADYAKILNENRNKAAAYANRIGEKVKEPFRDRNRRRRDDVAASSDVGAFGGLNLNQLLNTPNDMRNISPAAAEQGSAEPFYGREYVRDRIPPFAPGGASAFSFRTPLGVGQSTDEFTRNNLDLYFPNRGISIEGLADNILPQFTPLGSNRINPNVGIPRVRARAVPLDLIRANVGQADPRFKPLTGYGADIGGASNLLNIGLRLDKDAPSYNELIAGVPGLSINPNLPATTFANDTLNATINPFGITPSGARVGVANLTPAQREALRNEIERQRGRLAGVRPDTGINLSYFGGV
tara:strand:- start:16911 stop:17912 length:1002 start_codon:yes stop_codon:yes gene_type:complete